MGPLSILRECTGSKIYMVTRNKTEYAGTLSSYDPEMNLILKNATVTEHLGGADGQKASTTTMANIPEILVNGSHILYLVPGDTA